MEDIFAKPNRTNLDDLLDSVNARQIEEREGAEIPEAGTEHNPWIGFDRIVNGRKQFYALSGAERRQLRRHAARTEAAELRKGERRYNRQLRQREFDAGTVRQQARILKGEVQVTPAMMSNLQGAIMQQMRLNQRAQTAEERREARANQRAERLRQRQQARIEAGTARHADRVAAFGPDYQLV